MSKLGFKEITTKNWLTPDEILKAFVKTTASGLQPLTSHDYLDIILKSRLNESVPKDLQALFEVARGAMIYGYFFYPLFSLAVEQLFRVAEAAVTSKCELMDPPKSKKSFINKLKWLLEKGVIPDSDFAKWDALRHLRNAASHPKHQLIFTPGDTIDILEKISNQINFLFCGL